MIHVSDSLVWEPYQGMVGSSSLKYRSIALEKLSQLVDFMDLRPVYAELLIPEFNRFLGVP